VTPRLALIACAVGALSACGTGSGASQSGSTTLHVTVQGADTTIRQEVRIESTVDLTEYSQGRLLFNRPEGGLVSGVLLSASAVQELPSSQLPLKVAVQSSPAGLTVTGMQAGRSARLVLTYRVRGLVDGSVLTVPMPGSIVGRWSTVEIDVEEPSSHGHVSLAAGSGSTVASNETSGSGWRYVLTGVPGGSPAVTITTLA
jgi:hypothetical protein